MVQDYIEEDRFVKCAFTCLKGIYLRIFYQKNQYIVTDSQKDAQISTDFLYCIGILHIFDKSVFSLKSVKRSQKRENVSAAKLGFYSKQITGKFSCAFY